MDSQISALLAEVLQKEEAKPNEWNALHTIISFIQVQVFILQSCIQAEDISFLKSQCNLFVQSQNAFNDFMGRVQSELEIIDTTLVKIENQIEIPVDIVPGYNIYTFN